MPAAAGRRAKTAPFTKPRAAPGAFVPSSGSRRDVPVLVFPSPRGAAPASGRCLSVSLRRVMGVSAMRHDRARRPVPLRQTGLAVACQPLEPRRLLAGGPADLVARLPAGPDSINVRFQDVAPLGDRWVVTTQREDQTEKLYVTRPLDPADGPREPVLLYTSPYSADRDNTFGVTGLTSYRGEVYFLANDPQGDALLATDGSSVRTVKVFRPNNNALPQGISVVNDRMYFTWDSYSGIPLNWVSDGTTAGTVPVDRALSLPPPYLGGVPNFIADTESNDVGIIMYTQDASNTPRSVLFLDPGRVIIVTEMAANAGRSLVQATEWDTGVPALWSFDTSVVGGRISGSRYYDLNRNGTREGFEYSAGGTAYIDLNDNDRLDPSDLPAANPNALPGEDYLFDGLPARHSALRHPAEADGSPSDPATEYPIDLGPSQMLTHFDLPRRDPRGFAWGLLFEDPNGDGLRGPGEGAAAGVRVYLDQNNDGVDNGNEPYAVTAADGTYGIAIPASGTYTVRMSYTPRWVQTSRAGQPLGVITVGATDVVQIAAAGVRRVTPGSLTATVWFDNNRSGTVDGADRISTAHSVALDLNRDGVYTSGEPIATYGAFGNGLTFNEVAPGNYDLIVTGFGSPSRTVYTSPGGATQRVTVSPGATTTAPPFLIYDFDVPRDTGRISGSAWADLDGDGIRDPGEPPIAGRVVFSDTNS